MRFELGTVVSGFHPHFPVERRSRGGGRGLSGFPRVDRVANRFEPTLRFPAKSPRSPLARRGGRQPSCSASRCEGSAGGGAGWPRREPLSPPDARMNIKQDLG